MPISQIRVQNYRAFQDTGNVNIGAVCALVGKNDVGKSAILHALQLFFDPPKKGGIALTDLHGKDDKKSAVVEIAFRPEKLKAQDLQIDAKNSSNIVSDHLVDAKGFLRIRLTATLSSVEGFELCVYDVDTPGLFPLGLKNQEQLLELLTSRALPAKKAGKETNQEKRNVLRADAKAKGAKDKEEWVDAKLIEKAIRTILPEFILFEDTARFAVSETSVQNQFKGIVDRALAANPTAKSIETDIANTLQEEFDKVFERLRRLTDTVTSMRASPSVSWKKAIESIGLNWGDSAGIELPFESRGAGIRRLFMVAYFQYEAAASMHDSDGQRFVFAVEEPELHLHPSAQRLLNEAFRDLSGFGHCVIFTTHSPAFVASTLPDNLILISRNGSTALASQTPQMDIRGVASELGVEASDRLVGKNNIVLVEGKQDEEFYGAVLQSIFEKGHTRLDPAKVCFLQCGGIQNVQYAVTSQRLDEVGLKWAVIVDSDRKSSTEPLSTSIAALSSARPSTCLCFKVLEGTSIENYLDPAAIRSVTDIECNVSRFGPPTNNLGRPLGSSLVNKIKDNAGKIASLMTAESHLLNSKDGSGQSEWVLLFDELQSGFGL